MVKAILLGIVAMILLGLLATLWQVRHRKALAEKIFPAEGTFVYIDGHPVHYVSQGNPSMPAVILLHGASGNTRDFTYDLVDRLSDRYHVIVFDRPGLGHTPPLASQGVTLSDQAALLSAAALKLGADQPIVVGQSFGGAVTMAWAVHFPDRIAAAVSIAGATYPWEGNLNRFYAHLADPLQGPVIANLIGAWASRDYVKSSISSIFAPQSAPQDYANYIGVPLILRPTSLIANAQQRTDLRAQLRALAPQYAGLSLPVEIIHGDADTTVGINVHATRMVNDIAGANLVALPGVGHMPHHTNPQAVVAAIDRAAMRAGLH